MGCLAWGRRPSLPCWSRSCLPWWSAQSSVSPSSGLPIDRCATRQGWPADLPPLRSILLQQLAILLSLRAQLLFVLVDLKDADEHRPSLITLNEIVSSCPPSHLMAGLLWLVHNARSAPPCARPPKPEGRRPDGYRHQQDHRDHLCHRLSLGAIRGCDGGLELRGTTTWASCWSSRRSPLR